MTPFRHNLTIYQGATFHHPFRWKAGTPPTPVDLTGCTARMQVRLRVDSPTALLTLTTETGGITLGAEGSIVLRVDAAATTAINWTSGVYDLEVTLSNGDIRRLLYGSVQVSPEVTRD